MTRVPRERRQPQEPQSAPRSLLVLTGTVAAVWFGVALLASLTPISDTDLAFHIAWGRNLLADFWGVRRLLLGQDPSVAVYAYSYWLYQIVVVWLLDHLGPWGLVLFRVAMVLGMFATAFLLAGRLGASLWARSVLLAFGIMVASERFVDRPDLFSHWAWIVAVWILARHRRDRAAWILVPLLVLWVNTHHYFSLLFLLIGAFVVGDAIDGHRDLRRAGNLLGVLVVATLINPIGPGVWLSQLKLLGALTGKVAPIPVSELVGSYASYHPFLSLRVLQIGLPICVLMAIAARRRIGSGVLLVVLGSAILAVVARRAMSLFAVTAVALMPAAMDDAVAWLRAPSVRLLRLGCAAVTALVGLAGVIGLANGRIFLAQDKEYRVGAVTPATFPATNAARFLRAWNIKGPILHDPVSAGAILMENGTRLSPFLDPRWCGTDESNRIYVALTFATDSTIARTWESIQRSRGFETVMLDFYGMPALLRHVAAHRDWPLVYYDDRIAVFCRRGGENARAIAALEPRVAASWAGPDTAREAALAAEVLRFLGSRKPFLLAPVEFPIRSFRLANFFLQLGSRPNVQAAYLDLFRHEAGSLLVCRHRVDILINTLWCLGDSRQWEAREALCAALAGERNTPTVRLLALRTEQSRALLELGRAPEAERIAATVIADPAATAGELWWAWFISAHARVAARDNDGAIRALRNAARILPAAPQTYGEIANILATSPGRGAEALQAYATFQSLGGQDSAIDERIRQLQAR